MIIKQPKDMNISTYNGTLGIKWSGSFGNSRSSDIKEAQAYIDSECIRQMIPYTPMKSGALYKSPMLHTEIGSGEIKQTMPYARYQYYGEVYGPNIPIFENDKLIGFFSPPHKTPTGRELKYNTTKHPRAGKKWFERMKADKKDFILSGVVKILGGKAK